MKLKKEDVYIDLRGKSKEELTDLWRFLDNAGEKLFRDDLDDFLTHSIIWRFLEFDYTSWCFSDSKKNTEVTIEQLKDILKPNLQKQLENAKKYVERIEKLIMEENSSKIGEWCRFWDDDKSDLCIGRLRFIYDTHTYKYLTSNVKFENCEKITNPELIKLLEDESK